MRYITRLWLAEYFYLSQFTLICACSCTIETHLYECPCRLRQWGGWCGSPAGEVSIRSPVWDMGWLRLYDRRPVSKFRDELQHARMIGWTRWGSYYDCCLKHCLVKTERPVDARTMHEPSIDTSLRVFRSTLTKRNSGSLSCTSSVALIYPPYSPCVLANSANCSTNAKACSFDRRGSQSDW